MTGPEHYQEAERLLRVAGASGAEADQRYCHAAAQVHATLALAAVTAEASTRQGAYPGPMVLRPLPGDNVDPPYPGNDWGRAIYGEAIS